MLFVNANMGNMGMIRFFHPSEFFNLGAQWKKCRGWVAEKFIDIFIFMGLIRFFCAPPAQTYGKYLLYIAAGYSSVTPAAY